MNEIILYVAGIIPLFWGTAHLFPTKSVVKSFGDISEDNKKILTMEWVNEGLALIFVGSLVILNTAMGSYISLIYWSSAVMLFSMAILSLATGARTSQFFFKLCPILFGTAATLLLLGTYVF